MISVFVLFQSFETFFNSFFWCLNILVAVPLQLYCSCIAVALQLHCSCIAVALQLLCICNLSGGLDWKSSFFSLVFKDYERENQEKNLLYLFKFLGKCFFKEQLKNHDALYVQSWALLFCSKPILCTKPPNFTMPFY